MPNHEGPDGGQGVGKMIHFDNYDFDCFRGGGAMVAREIPVLKVVRSIRTFLMELLFFGVLFIFMLPGIHKTFSICYTKTVG
jgi:hypothetical protein